MTSGIKETKEIVTFITNLVKAIELSLKDGKISATDSVNFMPVLMSSMSAVSGITDVPIELKDLTAEEVDELVSFVKTELTLSSEKTEKILETAIDIGIALIRLFNTVREAKAS